MSGLSKIELRLNAKMLAYLDQLLRTGLYGFTHADVIERLIAQGLIEKLASGQLVKEP